MTVRVRFAPSPTGYLHVGGARTALFNYLYARAHQGALILRIEDTDLARSTEESIAGILEGLRFLGLTWDEGPEVQGAFSPYLQSERLHLYQHYARTLLEENKAYQCYCTASELQAKREQAAESKHNIHYDGRCRHLNEEQRVALEAEGRPKVVRFVASSEGTTLVRDLIRGDVRFDNGQIDDFVILKSDGMPTYNFAVVVDDATMKISHVIRGEDHLSNTPKQIQLYEALGFPLPEFAHIPMILGPDKTRLSKRHGATSVTQFRDEGYLASAMVNYLALLGWSFDDSQTLFSGEELISKFSLAKVSKNPAVFDIKKLQWMNGVYIRELPLEQLWDRACPLWQRNGYLPENPTAEQRDRGLKILEQVQPRLKLLGDLHEATYYFFASELVFNEKAVRKVLLNEQAKRILSFLLTEFLRLRAFGEPELATVFEAAREHFDTKLGNIIQPVRVAVTGTNVSPGIYDVLVLLGRSRSCQRMKEAVELIKRRTMEG